jgi:Protein of unknown function (DUF3667)
METNYNTNCANCNAELEVNAKFCHKCGQKKFNGRIAFKEVVHEFIHTTLHLDTKLFKTLKYLFVPGKLTKEYFLGKHKTYANPVQLFFVTGTICFIIFKTLSHGSEDKFYKTSIKEKKIEFQKEAVIQLDSINHVLHKNASNDIKNALNTSRDSLLSMILNEKKPSIIDSLEGNFNNHKEKVDTLGSLGQNFKITRSNKKKNEIFLRYKINKDKETDSELSPDSSSLNMFGIPDKILTKDLLDLSINQLYEKYKIKGFWNKQFLKIYQKYHIQGAGNFINFFLGKIFISIIFIILLAALVLKLLYWRQKRYYIEHIIFLLHMHSVYFLIIPILYVLNLTLHISWGWQIFLLIFYGIAMKKYYNQRKTKTILKYIAFSFSYFMITFFVLLCTFFLSAMIF